MDLYHPELLRYVTIVDAPYSRLVPALAVAPNVKAACNRLVPALAVAPVPKNPKTIKRLIVKTLQPLKPAPADLNPAGALICGHGILPCNCSCDILSLKCRHGILPCENKVLT